MPKMTAYELQFLSLISESLDSVNNICIMSVSAFIFGILNFEISKK